MPNRAAIAACALAHAVWAGAAVSANDAIPSAAAGVPGEPVPPKVIVLRNGDVFEGAIRFTQNGYEIDRGGGRVFLADSYVWIKAQSRRDAYEQMHERLPYGTASEHVALARWCLTNRLYSCAQDELKVALTLEPDHADARSTLKTLDEVLRTGESSGGKRKETAKAATPLAPRLDDSAKPADGVAADVRQEFVAKIQPLLVNCCGNAACHGTASQGSFRLQNVKLGHGAFRQFTEANLQAVLGQIDAAAPPDSPLLVQPRQPGHGSVRRPIFDGAAGEAQWKTFAKWVTRAAPSAATEETKPADETPLVLTAAQKDAESVPAIVPAVAEGEMPPADSPRGNEEGNDAASELLRRTIAEQRPDAFDPAEFNRRFGPQRPPASSTPSEGPRP